MNDRRLVPPAKAARLLFQLPRTCRVFCQIEPGNQWGWTELLANKANYFLEVLAWQKTKDASKKLPRHKPKPYIPEFMQPPKTPGAINNDAELHTTEDIRNILALPRA